MTELQTIQQYIATDEIRKKERRKELLQEINLLTRNPQNQWELQTRMQLRQLILKIIMNAPS